MTKHTFAASFLAQRVSLLLVRRLLDGPWDVQEVSRRCGRSVRWVRNKLSGRNLRARDLGILSAAMECDFEVRAFPKGELLMGPADRPVFGPSGMQSGRDRIGWSTRFLPTSATSRIAILAGHEGLGGQ